MADCDLRLGRCEPNLARPPLSSSLDSAPLVTKALAIAGSADFVVDGEFGAVSIEGPFAEALIAEMRPNPTSRAYCVGHPVKLSRFSSLELWCNGFYVECPGVRALVHRAASAMGVV